MDDTKVGRLWKVGELKLLRGRIDRDIVGVNECNEMKYQCTMAESHALA